MSVSRTTPSSLPSGVVTIAVRSPRLRSRSANSASGRSGRTVDGPASIASSARAAGSASSTALRSRPSSVPPLATTSANPYGERHPCRDLADRLLGSGGDDVAAEHVFGARDLRLRPFGRQPVGQPVGLAGHVVLDMGEAEQL